MTTPALSISYHRLDTTFFDGHVQHATFHSDTALGQRRVKVLENWYRDRELGRGTFGTVYLERSGKGELRAVKEIAKDRNSQIGIDYKRELAAMAILRQHVDLFVQLFGWYENDNYVWIAMEYIRYGNLRNYLEVERTESEAKAVTRQLLEGLVIIHQEGFAHRDLKPDNIFVVSTSPIWVKIGDFGMAKLVRSHSGTAFRTHSFMNYAAPEMTGVDEGSDTSEYTNAVDIWALGCIAHEALTHTLPFRSLRELASYCIDPKFPGEFMLSKNISKAGVEIIERMLSLSPELRVTAKQALGSEWLRLEDEGAAGPETEAFQRQRKGEERIPLQDKGGPGPETGAFRGQRKVQEWLPLQDKGAVGPATEEVQRQMRAQKWEEVQIPGWRGARTVGRFVPDGVGLGEGLEEEYFEEEYFEEEYSEEEYLEEDGSEEDDFDSRDLGEEDLESQGSREYYFDLL